VGAFLTPIMFYVRSDDERNSEVSQVDFLADSQGLAQQIHPNSVERAIFRANVANQHRFFDTRGLAAIRS